MDSKQRILFQSLENNLKKDLDKASAAAELLFEGGGLSKNAKRRLMKSLAAIVKATENPVNQIRYLEYARSISPNYSPILNHELRILEHIFKEWHKEFVEEDYLIFSAILKMIIEPYRKNKLNFFAPAIKIEIDLQRKIQEFSPHTPKEKESKVSYQLELIFNSIEPEKTNEERIKKAAEILAPYIVEKWQKKQKEGKKGSKGKKN